MGRNSPIGVLMGGQAIGNSAVGGYLHYVAYEHGTGNRRLEGRHQQPVISPGVDAAQSARGVSPNSVGDKPFPAD
jgi:hypothetical protein